MHRALPLLYSTLTGVCDRDRTQSVVPIDAAVEPVDGFSYIRSGHSAALPIVSELLSLPERAAVVDMKSVLPPCDYEWISNPSNFLKTAQELLDCPPPSRPRVFGSRREVTSAVRRLVDIGMVELSDDPPIVESGCFCVSKPGSTARRVVR